MSEVRIRPIEAGDREACGRILFEAFADIADRHGFPRDFASVEVATGLMGHFLASKTFGVVAERGGRVLGSNFLSEGDPIVAVGPVSVDPALQESGVGRRLMEAMIERGRGARGVRLVQDSFNRTSMALYAAMGFDVRDPLVLLQGTPRSGAPTDVEVRRLAEPDLEACAALCHKVHGITRSEELRGMLGRFPAYVAVRDRRVTAYASTVSLWFAAHGVAENEADLRALLLGAAADGAAPLHFLLPTRQADLFRWALEEGLRILKPMSLMTMGPWQEPQGAWFPSVGY